MVGRLGKYFARVAGDDKTPVEDKVKDADDLEAKAVARVRKAAAAIEAEVDAYRQDLADREEAAVWQAKKSVSDLVSKATDELGRGWTWLDGTSAKDWQRALLSLSLRARALHPWHSLTLAPFALEQATTVSAAPR